MGPMKIAALVAATAVAAVLATVPADAAKKQPRYYGGVEPRGGEYPTRITVVDETGRPRTRITVRKRSYLDPGTESLPFDRHYADYAVPPNYTIFPRFFDYSVAPGSFDRRPLPGLWDVPGWRY